MKISLGLLLLCMTLNLAQDAGASEYFEVYSGINVWARTSFRIRLKTTVQRCARTCVNTPACSAFVFSRVTRRCYGRKNLKLRNRGHWHRSRRYDFYHKLTGSDRRRVEGLVPETRNRDFIFVERQSIRTRGIYKQVMLSETGRIVTSSTAPLTTTTRTTTTTTAKLRPTTRKPRRLVTAKPERSTTVPRLEDPMKKTRVGDVEFVAKPSTRPTPTREHRRTVTTKPTRRIKVRPTGVTNIAVTCDRPIGLEEGTFPYDRITASSYWWRFTPSNIAVNSGSGWMASRTFIGEYVEIDFGEPKTISAIATQGSSYLFMTEYVSEYKLKFLYDLGGTFETYTEQGRERIFVGNSDSTTIRKNRLRSPVRAYKMQIHPLKFKRHMMMRVEVYETC